MASKQTNWSRAWVERSYDRIGIFVPKGRKAQLQQYAKEHGISVNGILSDYVRSILGISAEDWNMSQKEPPH